MATDEKTLARDWAVFKHGTVADVHHAIDLLASFLDGPDVSSEVADAYDLLHRAFIGPLFTDPDTEREDIRQRKRERLPVNPWPAPRAQEGE